MGARHRCGEEAVVAGGPGKLRESGACTVITISQWPRKLGALSKPTKRVVGNVPAGNAAVLRAHEMDSFDSAANHEETKKLSVDEKESLVSHSHFTFAPDEAEAYS